MLFYDNFERMCRLRGTSPSGAVAAIGKNKTTAGNWKRNNTIPSEDILLELSDHLNCYVSDFFRTPGEPPSEYAQMMDGEPLESGSGRMLPDDGTVDTAVLDFHDIYEQSSKREKSELMALVYRFAEEQGIDVDGAER